MAERGCWAGLRFSGDPEAPPKAGVGIQGQVRWTTTVNGDRLTLNRPRTRLTVPATVDGRVLETGDFIGEEHL